MEVAIITAIIGAIATVFAAYITARTKDKTYSDKLRQGSSSLMLSPKDYDIKIVNPADYEIVSTNFSVSGTYKILPEDHQIWISTFDVQSDEKGVLRKRYWPQRKATSKDGKWYSGVNDISGKSGEVKEFVVLVAGKNGIALFNYFEEAGIQNNNWPPITNLTSDIVPDCALGRVRMR